MKERESEPIRVYEFINQENKFKEISKKFPLYTILNSDKIILIIDLNRDWIWHWRGSNTTPVMQSAAKKSLIASIRDTYILKRFPTFDTATTKEKFILMKSITHLIDEGDEPSDFKILVGLVEKPNFPEFKINKFLTLKLENNKTFIYIKGKKFIQCIRLFLQIPPQKSNLYDKIESIDEATQIFDKYLYENKIVKGELPEPIENHTYRITPDQEFWGHCSNIQAWVEHKYDTRLLHSNLSFPLLKMLSEVGDQFALLRFREEIAFRLEGGYYPVIMYLFEENYFKYLPTEDLRDLRKKISGAVLPHSLPHLFKWMNRKNTEDYKKKSSKEYSKLKRLKDLLYVPHIINQTSPRDLIIGLANLNFTFLDFFLSPDIKHKEVYLEKLSERLIEGLKSEDPLFYKATVHFIERIMWYIRGKKTKQRESNINSITWLLEKVYENGGERIIIDYLKYYLGIVDNEGKFLSQLELIEDPVSFRNFLNRLIENNESKK